MSIIIRIIVPIAMILIVLGNRVTGTRLYHGVRRKKRKLGNCRWGRWGYFFVVAVFVGVLDVALALALALAVWYTYNVPTPFVNRSS